MKNNAFIKAGTLLILIALMLTACAPAANQTAVATQAPVQTAEMPSAPAVKASEPPATTQNVVKIGGLYPLSGENAIMGQGNADGLALAINEINQAGGIKSLGGAKIEIVWGDTQGKPEIGISEVTRLVQQENVVAIVGAYQSSVTTPATQEAERLKTPFLVSMAISDKITERGFKYTFRVCPKASWYAKDQVTFLQDLKDLAGLEVKQVALLHEDTDFGESTAEGQKKYLQEAGMEMVLEVKYSSSAADLTTEVSKIKASNPDAVLTVTYLNDALLIARARQALGLMNIPFIDAAGGTLDAEFVKQLGPAAEGWFTEVEFSKFAVGANVLNDAFKAMFGEDITGNGAYAYQAGYVIADALERAASIDREAVRAALAATDMRAGTHHVVMPTDRIYFDESGQNPNAPLFIVQIQNGELIPVWPAEFAAARPIMLTP